ncbi:toprim domain-containing protein [Novosphingobium cyanobacteriorum]|uniref:Toprim domain-containing protein n=1 Tax=Novosphingobium cyanobacteriorum TaxID=3024215 RepID=A0ABT6CMF3_9SPHN|nr:toprim domain-containing protein [Novosphingobium cyanobacteriorum]MDF8335092.1 toprim domain-containing protein [Novosphingobium cyanobacteriorum]
MLTLQSIAQALGGQICGREVLAPTPGHSKHDRGTAVRLAPGAPDGLLVACYNGGWHEVAQVKDALRNAGILPGWDGHKRELTQAEREAIRRAVAEREREKALAQAHAAENARRSLAGAQPADPAHPYLASKRIAPERLWQGMDAYGCADALLIPMQDDAGRVWNVQSIVPSRDKAKLYVRGARTKGLFWWAGKATDRLVIGEGVATVAAVRRATGLPVIAAMTASNLPAVAAKARERLPRAHITIAADDDPAGHEYARKAAALSAATIVYPKEASQ